MHKLLIFLTAGQWTLLCVEFPSEFISNEHVNNTVYCIQVY